MVAQANLRHTIIQLESPKCLNAPTTKSRVRTFKNALLTMLGGNPKHWWWLEDCCPKGWHLPNQYKASLQGQNGKDNNLHTNPNLQRFREGVSFQQPCVYKILGLHK